MCQYTNPYPYPDPYANPDPIESHSVIESNSPRKREKEREERERTHLLQIHSFHRLVHPLDDVGHAARDLAHGDGGLHAAGDGIDPAPQAEEVEPLVLLADGVLGVDLGDVGVALLDRLGCGCVSTDVVCRRGEGEGGGGTDLLQLVLLGLLILGRLCGLPVELLGRELRASAGV